MIYVGLVKELSEDMPQGLGGLECVSKSSKLVTNYLTVLGKPSHQVLISFTASEWVWSQWQVWLSIVS